MVHTNLVPLFANTPFKLEQRGGYDPRQTWSGAVTQLNIWDFPMEEYHVEVNFHQSEL